MLKESYKELLVLPKKVATHKNAMLFDYYLIKIFHHSLHTFSFCKLYLYSHAAFKLFFLALQPEFRSKDFLKALIFFCFNYKNVKRSEV